LNINSFLYKTSTLLFLLLFVTSPQIYPQDSTDEITEEESQNNQEDPLSGFKTVDEESKEAIFDFKIGDSDVDFYITGSWEANFVFSSGFLIRPDFGASLLDEFPGVEPGFLFEQVPDLTLSIWLMNRFFVEFSVLGSFENNSFLMGYQGEEDEFLRHLYIGNRDINIDPYPFVSIPDQGESSIGAEAEFLSGNSIHQLLLRFDNNDEGKATYIGYNEVTEERIQLNDFIKGCFFKLPDENVENLTVYIEDPDGSYSDLNNSINRNDGRKYRKAGLQDATLDSERGIVILKEEPFGRILVYYTKNGLPVGSAGIGEDSIAVIDSNGFLDPDNSADFNWMQTIDYLTGSNTMRERRSAVIGSDECLLLWEPGSFSPFEIQSYYYLPENSPNNAWRILVWLVNKEGTDDIETLPDIRFEINTDDYYFYAYKSIYLRDDLNNLYPFFNIDGSTNDWIYGPFSNSIEGKYDKEILLNILNPVSGFFLDSNVLPGSVQVFRNGAEETRFEVDYDTGEVVFKTEINPTDRIEIYYKKEGSLLNNGDLLFVWGNKVPLNDNLNLQIAAGFKWNILPGAYSETAFSRTGAFISSLNLRGEYEHFTYNIETAVSYTNPDTTGILRLSGMEKEGLDMSLSENTAYPSCPPSKIINSINMTSYNRGMLYYKNYREYDFLGSYILHYSDWELPGSQNFPYVNESKTGPYTVKDSSEDSVDSSLVLDFDLTGAKSWVGIQIPVYQGENTVDMSSLKSLVLSFKAIDVSGSFDVHIEIGEIGEDIDSDNELDKENSEYSTGFIFNDASNDVYLYVGDGPRQEGNGQIDTEDIDGNGFLDTEFSENILTLENFLSISGDTGWLSESVIFTSNQREQLIRTRAIRIIISGNDCSGRLLIDKLHLSGTTFAITGNTAPAGIVNIQEIREEASQNSPEEENELINTHSIVGDVFHSSGEIQKILEIEWFNFPDSDSWTVRGYTDTGTEGAVYRELNMFIRFPELTPASDCNFTFKLLDSESNGITWSFSHEPFEDWRNLRLKLDKKQLYIGDRLIEDAEISLSSSYGSLNQLYITAESSGNISHGLLYIDELYFSEPEGAIGGALSVETVLNYPGTVLAINGIPVFSDIIFREYVYSVSPGFSPLYGRPSKSWDTSSLTELSFGLFFIYFDLYFQAEGTDDKFDFSGGHKIHLPRFDFPVVFTDSFDYGTYSSGIEFERNNTLNLYLNKFSFGSSTGASTRESVLSQKWDIDFSINNSRGTILNYSFGLTKSSDQYEHNKENYFDSWTYAYVFIIPWKDGDPIERTGNMNINIPCFSEPFGVQFDFTVSYKSTEIRPESRMQYNYINYDLSFPVVLNKNQEFIITPGYVREGSNSDEHSSEGDLFYDFGMMWYSFYLQTYVCNQPPFYEIWSENTKNEFIERTNKIEEAFYYPQVYIGITRRISSHITSLFLPTKMTVSTGRTYEKDHDLYEFLNKYYILYQTNSINLFGKFGSYPVFKFYNIDEFINSFKTELTFEENGDFRDCEYNIENIMSFEGRNENILTLENYLTIIYDGEKDVTDKFSAGFKWFIYPENGIRLPLIKERIVKTGYLIHDEVLSLEFKNRVSDSSSHPANILFTHSTSIRYPEHGFFKAYASLGFDFESAPAEDSNIYRILFQLGIDIRIEF
jgi:hypothetical protein